MINILAKESRLIIVFFLTVIILGSMLVFLSMTNISTYKELTEKKISEEESVLAEQFSTDFQREIESLVVTFKNLTRKDSLNNIDLFKNKDTIRGIQQVIKMKENGAFLWPHFRITNATLKKENSSLIFLEKIKRAEYNEFVIQDYKKAIENYLSVLATAKFKSDSAQIFNALSRLYQKTNQPDKAFDNATIILSQFSNTVNSSGFPYAYFSINHLLKINDPTKNTKIQKLLASFLTDLSTGKTPLNYSSSDLLDQILDWTIPFEKNKDFLKMEALVQYIMDYIRLINNYTTPISKIINGENLKKSEITIGDFHVLYPISDASNEVLLFNNNISNFKGFRICLDELFDIVRQKPVQNQTKFEYQIELLNNKGQPFFSDNGLIYISEFSSYFKDHRIKIALKNEHIVEEYVFKRKLLYGAGFILLLGVMAFGFILLVQNVKREKQMERLKADFVSNVTHELKTPLTSIYMFAESIFLERTQSKKNLKKYSNIILKESEKLQRMINNILEFSRKENDKLKYEIKDSNLSKIVNSTVKEMNYWLEINKFNVQLEIQEHVNAKVNRDGIVQALSNLISNAIKYSGEKKKLIIRLIKKESTAWIEVEDFGIGIPEDKLDRIFEKFYRVNSKENETTSGTGLGLTVTKDIIVAQNGKLLVQSDLGKGSKFTIVLNIS